MNVYLDADFKCHTIYADGRVEVTAPENFDGMCEKAIECMRYVPAGMTYTKPNGMLVHGEFIQCFDSVSATAYQVQYDEMKAELDEAQTALDILLGEVSV